MPLQMRVFVPAERVAVHWPFVPIALSGPFVVSYVPVLSPRSAELLLVVASRTWSWTRNPELCSSDESVVTRPLIVCESVLVFPIVSALGDAATRSAEMSSALRIKTKCLHHIQW